MVVNYCTDDEGDQPSRILITGASGSGKSNILLNLIYDILCFDRLYFCAKDLSELKYEQLIENLTKYQDVKLTDINKVRKHRDLLMRDFIKCKKDYTLFCSSQEELPSVDELDSRYKNLVVFDDCVTDQKQTKIEDFFIRGRKKNATVVYLTQSYYATPVIIRRNCNVFILINLRKKDRQRILKETDDHFPDYEFKTPYDFIVLNTKTFTKNRYAFNSLRNV